jgi:hypothetical protein
MACTKKCPKSAYLHGFIGILSNVHRGFLKIANPIMELQKKTKNFVWNEKCAEAFRRLKEIVDDNTDIEGT